MSTHCTFPTHNIYCVLLWAYAPTYIANCTQLTHIAQIMLLFVGKRKKQKKSVKNCTAQNNNSNSSVKEVRMHMIINASEKNTDDRPKTKDRRPLYIQTPGTGACIYRCITKQKEKKMRTMSKPMRAKRILHNRSIKHFVESRFCVIIAINENW